MTAKTKTNARLTRELLETAKGMHASGIMNDAAYAAYEKITLRHWKRAATAPAAPPMTGDDIRAIREHAHMSQVPSCICPIPQSDGRLRFPIGTWREAPHRRGSGATQRHPPQGDRGYFVACCFLRSLPGPIRRSGTR
jgi:hypothetical protein